MSARAAIPADLDRRLTGLSEAVAAVSDAIEFAYVFGSTVTGRRTARSDVDVAIHVGPGADAPGVRLDLIRAVAKHLGTGAVDVVVLNAAPLSVAGRVLTSRKVMPGSRAVCPPCPRVPRGPRVPGFPPPRAPAARRTVRPWLTAIWCCEAGRS